MYLCICHFYLFLDSHEFCLVPMKEYIHMYLNMSVIWKSKCIFLTVQSIIRVKQVLRTFNAILHLPAIKCIKIVSASNEVTKLMILTNEVLSAGFIGFPTSSWPWILLNLSPPDWSAFLLFPLILHVKVVLVMFFGTSVALIINLFFIIYIQILSIVKHRYYVDQSYVSIVGPK